MTRTIFFLEKCENRTLFTTWVTSFLSIFPDYNYKLAVFIAAKNAQQHIRKRVNGKKTIVMPWTLNESLRIKFDVAIVNSHSITNESS